VTASALIQIGAFVAVLTALAVPFGAYLQRVFSGPTCSWARRSSAASAPAWPASSCSRCWPFTEHLWAYASQTMDNGSAFAGYTGFVQPATPAPSSRSVLGFVIVVIVVPNLLPALAIGPLSGDAALRFDGGRPSVEPVLRYALIPVVVEACSSKAASC
jgi:K+-transporting ATPase A subunit